MYALSWMKKYYVFVYWLFVPISHLKSTHSKKSYALRNRPQISHSKRVIHRYRTQTSHSLSCTKCTNIFKKSYTLCHRAQTSQPTNFGESWTAHQRHVIRWQDYTDVWHIANFLHKWKFDITVTSSRYEEQIIVAIRTCQRRQEKWPWQSQTRGGQCHGDNRNKC